MTLVWIVTGGALLASVAADRDKTKTALLKALKLFREVAPLLVGVLAIVSVVLAGVTPRMLQRFLEGPGPLPFFSALGIGSVALMPGFVAYPLAGVLRHNGASVPVLAAFITSLMMVGVVTLPIEARFFGWRAALLRNGLSLGGALVVSVGMSWVLT